MFPQEVHNQELAAGSPEDCLQPSKISNKNNDKFFPQGVVSKNRLSWETGSSPTPVKLGRLATCLAWIAQENEPSSANLGLPVK